MKRRKLGPFDGRDAMKKIIATLCLCFAFSAQAAPQQKTDVLWERFAAEVGDVEKDLDGVLGVAMLDLTSGRTFLLHPDEVFPQASSIKITVLAELYRQSEQGRLKLTDAYVVQATDIVQDSDIMGGLTPGVTTLTNRDLATMMVAVSDNAATNVLIDRVGMDNVKTMLEGQGLRETKLRRKMMDLKAAGEGRENVSTPREMMTLLEKLYHGKILGPTKDDFFTMLATHKNSWIPKPLPEGTKVADKPGELEGVRADSGVVFLDNRPYVLCVMTTYLEREHDGEQAISRISAAAFHLFDRLGRGSEYGRVISVSNGH